MICDKSENDDSFMLKHFLPHNYEERYQMKMPKSYQSNTGPLWKLFQNRFPAVFEKTMYFLYLSLMFVLYCDCVPSAGAAVLTEPLLQRGLPPPPGQVPVEPAAGQPLPDSILTGRKARPLWPRQTDVTFVLSFRCTSDFLLHRAPQNVRDRMVV